MFWIIFGILFFLLLIIIILRIFTDPNKKSSLENFNFKKLDNKLDSWIEEIPEEVLKTPAKESSKFSPWREEELEELYQCKRPFIPANSSKGERQCREFLQEYFGLPFKACRPLFLRNPETGYNLELDCYEGSLRLAVEYQGPTHYQFVKAFHKTEEDFFEQQRKDRFKAEICKRLGITLIRVPYTTMSDKIGKFIEMRLPQNLIKIKK